MRLTVESVVGYLLERDLIPASDVVDGRVRVIDVTRRNRSFKVVNGNEDGLLVKQAGWLNPEFATAVDGEGSLYGLVAHDDTFAPMRWFTPTWRGHDASNHVVVTTLVHPATSLTKYHLNGGEPNFSTIAARSAARVLATFAHAGGEEGRNKIRALLPPALPASLDPLSNFGMGGGSHFPAMAAMVRRVHADARLLALARQAASEWTPRGLFHGDVRWDNFLVTHGWAVGGLLNLRLIDWEGTTLGEPAWDVASYLTDYVRVWTNSAREAQPDEKASSAPRDPLDDAVVVPFEWDMVKPSIRAFWQAYVKEAGFDAARASEEWGRVAFYLPVKLATVGLEQTQRADVVPLRAKRTMHMAQVAAADPARFAHERLGIPVEA